MNVGGGEEVVTYTIGHEHKEYLCDLQLLEIHFESEDIVKLVSKTVLHARQKSIKWQAKVNVSGHCLHSYFELARSEVSQGSVEGQFGNCFINAVHFSRRAIYKVQSNI